MDDVIIFIPYGSRLGAHVGGPASTMANIDYKFPQCVCFAWANSGKAGLSDDENTSPTIKSSRNGEPAVIVLNDQGGGVMSVSDKANTLRAQDHGHPPIICMNQWENQARRIYGIDGVFPTLSAREKAGQNQQAICYEKDEK